MISSPDCEDDSPDTPGTPVGPPPDISHGFKVKKKKESSNPTNEFDLSSPRIKSFDIQKTIDWNKIVAVQATDSDEGSNGVFFLMNDKDEVFVIKGSSVVAEEIFASRISEMFLVNTPECVLIEYAKMYVPGGKKYGHDWSGATNTIKRLTENNLRIRLKCQKNLTRAFFLKMQFIKGKSLYQIDAKKVLTQKRVLKQLGNIFVFDIVINNHDRFPCKHFWNHEGNAEENVWGIDQCVSLIKNGRDNKYMNSCQMFVKCLKEDKPEENMFIKEIVKFLKDNTSFECNKKHMEFIWEGMNETMKKLKDVKGLDEIKEKIKKEKTGRDWENVYKTSVDKIDLEFIDKILTILRGK